MAVQVKAKSVSCPKCHELLEYTTADVTKTRQNERCTVSGDDGTYKCEQTYEIWSITCPTCYHTFQVDRYFVSSRKI